MSKFTFANPPALKTKAVKVEEWDADEQFRIQSIRASEVSEIAELIQELQKEGTPQSKGIEFYADILSRCLSTADGERPSKDWLMQAGFETLKRLGDEALEFNGLNQAGQDNAQKN